MGEQLTLKFDPLTIEHLGYKMYSHLPNALAELVANAYDADAHSVRVILNQRAAQRSVLVEDDGHGMSLDDLNDKYLRIGRNRRGEGEFLSESGRRRVAGKKGLGKLALFGIGETIHLVTSRAGATDELLVQLDWRQLRASTGDVYHPRLVRRPAPPERHGTTVELRNLRRRTDVDPGDLAVSLGRLFNYLDDDFRIEVVEEGVTFPVDRSSRLDALSVDIAWTVPEDLPRELVEGLPDPGIRGRIVSAAKPVRAEQRGIALYVHGRLANEPEFFGISESSYAFSYLTGFLDVDYIDDEDVDVISTDRRSVSWDSPTTQILRDFLHRLLQWAARDRREARRRANTERIRAEHGVDVSRWVETIRGPERDAVREAADVLVSPDSVISDDDRKLLIGSLRRIAPDYADLHWRHLHPKIREVAESRYRAELYHSALDEALKLYLDTLRTSAQLDGSPPADIVNKSLSGNEPAVDVTSPYGRCGLDSSTLRNMREGQHRLSLGAVAAFRNPIAHELEARLVGTGALTHQDCLDGLSLISHLFWRLENVIGGRTE